ncbi:hypothetical protein KKB83_01980, partial [Patescibacteria group bacterium]|nr:hypothetical protein [Patescibacteria group bacterium]
VAALTIIFNFRPCPSLSAYCPRLSAGKVTNPKTLDAIALFLGQICFPYLYFPGFVTASIQIIGRE